MGVLHVPFKRDLPLGINLKASLLPNWTTVRSAVKAGSGSGKIVLLGDSTTAGYGAAGAASSYTNTQAVAPPAQLRRLLSAHGIPAEAGNFMSDSNVNTQNGVATNTYDPRIVPASWTLPAGNGFCGGSFNTSGATVFAFTPTAPFDTIDVFYGSVGGAGTFTVDVDGGASLGTINCNQAADLRVQTLTCALGSHTINVTPPAERRTCSVSVAATQRRAGCTCSSAPTLAVRRGRLQRRSRTSLLQCRRRTRRRPDDHQPGYQRLGSRNVSIDVLDQHANDHHRRQQDRRRDSLTPFPSSTATSMASQNSIVDVIHTLAASNSVPLIDNFAAESSYAAGNAAAHYSDVLHPNGLGYNLAAKRIADVLAYI